MTGRIQPAIGRYGRGCARAQFASGHRSRGSNTPFGQIIIVAIFLISPTTSLINTREQRGKPSKAGPHRHAGMGYGGGMGRNGGTIPSTVIASDPVKGGVGLTQGLGLGENDAISEPEEPIM